MVVVRVPKDYTGVAVWQMADVFQRSGQSADQIAEQAGMNSRDLRKIIVEKKYIFTGLKVADRIFLAMGKNITALDLTGEINVIPASGPHAPRKMATDEFWANDIEPTPLELTDRSHELARLRDKILRYKA